MLINCPETIKGEKKNFVLCFGGADFLKKKKSKRLHLWQRIFLAFRKVPLKFNLHKITRGSCYADLIGQVCDGPETAVLTAPK